MHTNQISLLSSYNKLPAFIRLIAMFHLRKEIDLDSGNVLKIKWKFFANFLDNLLLCCSQVYSAGKPQSRKVLLRIFMILNIVSILITVLCLKTLS